MFESKKIIPFQVAKWVKIPLLIDEEEMENLFDTLPPFLIYDVQKVTGQGEGVYHPDDFLKSYRTYIALLKEGVIPALSDYRGFFSSVWSVDGQALYSFPLPEGRHLLKVKEPVIQTQFNQIRYSEEAKTFHTQVYSSDSFSWGIQIGFPHLFLDPTSCEPLNTRDFPNMKLFSPFQKWVRSHTLPTPFLVSGQKIQTPIRLGKKCLSWINSHPQLRACGIGVFHGS